MEKTYRFLQIPLHNRERTFVLDILHHEPTQRLLIFAVHLARFYQLGFELVDAGCVVSGVEVHDDSVHHGDVRDMMNCWGAKLVKLVGFVDESVCQGLSLGFQLLLSTCK